MARCTYCGQPVGFRRTQHEECRDRYQRAISTIPALFAKVLESSVSPERFCQLLRSAAETSFVQPNELDALCGSGINNIIDSILQERPLTVGELQRIIELSDALGVDASKELGLEEKLVKVSIVSDLFEGKIPDPISVVGPMPIKLGRGETILWIFNEVASYQMTADKEIDGPSVLSNTAVDNSYLSPKVFDERHMPARPLSGMAKGDLVLTNRNIYFLLSADARNRIPISRITALQAYAEGIRVVWNPAEERSRILLLDDPWFVANVIARLIQLARR